MAGGGCWRRLGVVDPVSLALKRIRRELDASAASACVHGCPVDRNSANVERRERAVELRRIIAIPTQGVRDGDRLIGDDLGDERCERWRGPDLEKDVAARCASRFDSCREAHWLSCVTPPVVSLRRGVHWPRRAGEVRDERDARSGELNGSRRRLELVEHRIEERRVERVRDTEPLCAYVARRELRADRVDVDCGSGDDDVVRSVHCRHGDDSATLGGRDDRGLYLRERRKDRRHGAARRQRLHESRAFRDEREGRVERHDTRHACRHVFADTVPEHDARRHAPATPQLGERPLEREKGRLRERGLIDEVCVGPPHEGCERFPEQWCQNRVATVERVVKH